MHILYQHRRQAYIEEFEVGSKAALGPNVYLDHDTTSELDAVRWPISVPRGLFNDSKHRPSSRDMFSKRIPDLSHGWPKYGDTAGIPDSKHANRIGQLDTTEGGSSSSPSNPDPSLDDSQSSANILQGTPTGLHSRKREPAGASVISNPYGSQTQQIDPRDSSHSATSIRSAESDEDRDHATFKDRMTAGSNQGSRHVNGYAEQSLSDSETPSTSTSKRRRSRRIANSKPVKRVKRNDENSPRKQIPRLADR